LLEKIIFFVKTNVANCGVSLVDYLD